MDLDFFETEIVDVQQELIFQLAGHGHRTRQIQKKLAEINTEIRNCYHRVKVRKPGEDVLPEDENTTIASALAKYSEIVNMQSAQIDSIQGLKGMIETTIEKTGSVDDDNYDSVYCYCGRTSSNMICCESSNCSIKWYHFECSGVSEEETRPDKKWICHRCLYDDLFNKYKDEIEVEKSNLKNQMSVSNFDDISKLTEDEQIIPRKRKIIESEAEDVISK